MSVSAGGPFYFYSYKVMTLPQTCQVFNSCSTVLKSYHLCQLLDVEIHIDSNILKMS